MKTFPLHFTPEQKVPCCCNMTSEVYKIRYGHTSKWRDYNSHVEENKISNERVVTIYIYIYSPRYKLLHTSFQTSFLPYGFCQTHYSIISLGISHSCLYIWQ